MLFRYLSVSTTYNRSKQQYYLWDYTEQEEEAIAVAFLTSSFKIHFRQALLAGSEELLCGHCDPHHLRLFESLFSRDIEDVP